MLYFGTAWRSAPRWESAPKWNTVVQLRNRKIPYVEDFKAGRKSCIRLTAAGRHHYDANLGRYRATYPAVEVSGPDSPAALHRADPAQLRADAEPAASSSHTPPPSSRPTTPAKPDRDGLTETPPAWGCPFRAPLGRVR